MSKPQAQLDKFVQGALELEPDENEALWAKQLKEVVKSRPKSEKSA